MRVDCRMSYIITVIDYQTVEKLDASALDKPDIQRRLSVLKKKVDEINEKRKTEVLGNLKDLGNTILGNEFQRFNAKFS